MGRKRMGCIEVRQKPINTFLVGTGDREFEIQAHRFALEHGRAVFYRDNGAAPKEIVAVFESADYIICQTDHSASPAKSGPESIQLLPQKTQSQDIPFTTPSPE